MEPFVILISALNLLAMITLGISEIRKRRSEAHLNETDVTDKITEAASKITDSAIKMLGSKDEQVSKILIENQEIRAQNAKILEENKEIRSENQKIHQENEEIGRLNLLLREEVVRLQLKVDCLERKLKGSQEDCSGITDKLRKNEISTK